MIKQLVLSLICILTIGVMTAQSRHENLGNKYFDEYSYDQAIRYFENVKDKSNDINRKLAISYFKINDYEQAEWYYTQVVNAPNPDVEDYFNYSQVLAMQEKYPESVRWMTKYHEEKSGTANVSAKIQDPEYYLDLIKEENGYSIRNLDINSDEQDFGTNFYGDGITFASSRTGVQTVVRKWNWNQLGFLDIYTAKLDTSNYELSEAEPHHRKFNKKYHEGPASFNAEGDIMMFTSNNYSGRSSKDVVTLEMFESRKVNGKWQKPVPVPYNSKEYSVGHGTLSLDGNSMFFVSDMPGGFGGTDIYQAERKADGTWGEARLLSEEINTEGNEMFPYFHPDSILFFSSNGHPGLGGLDVFFNDVRKLGLNRTTNMNAPINSSRDDFAFIMNAERDKGFFSSNRIGGMGDDDIYAYEREEPLKFNQLLRGKVINEIGQIVPNVKVLLYDEDGQVLTEVMTGEDGSYMFEVEQERRYSLLGEKTEYSKGLGVLDTEPGTRDYMQDLMIRKPVPGEKERQADLNGEYSPLTNDGPIDLNATRFTTNDSRLVTKEVFTDVHGLSLHSRVRDIRTGDPIDGATIILYDKITGEEIDLISPETGDNTWLLDEGKYSNKRYAVKIQKQGYYPMEFDFDTPDDAMGQHSYLANLIPMVGPDERLDIDMAKAFAINPIYFDLDKYNIRDDAAMELNKVIDLMHEYPNMVIELTSHTDCRATKGYNNRLSNNRARSTAAFIRERVEDRSRITGQGLGEMELVNDCECEGVVVSDCTEAEHQRNRRTEFRIVRM